MFIALIIASITLGVLIGWLIDRHHSTPATKPGKPGRVARLLHWFDGRDRRDME